MSYKPENALRRAVELQSINQTDAALSLLHDALASRRHKTWSPTYETIMMRYLDLCLQLNRSREAKDGLHQYRNLSQHQAPGSLEIVIRHLIDSADAKCRKAKERSEEMRSTSTSLTTGSVGVGTGTSASTSSTAATVLEVDDLDASNTPQSILLSTMSVDPQQTQRETSLLLPQLKFLWETYRAVLDILRSNSKLEHLYHSAALGALEFCKTYRRKTEFRRLCDMLRQHLGNLQKYGNVTAAAAAADAANASADAKGNKLRGWEGWTPESIELHLQTRFAQLETASYLELYTEGFRATEDIYSIMQISKRAPKAKLMATYYEKLIGIFWVSENLLFHAFAWYKYYTLCREYNKSMSDEMKVKQASCVLLAALCIPTISGSGPGTNGDNNADSKLGAVEGESGVSGANGVRSKPISSVEDDIAREKTSRLATLLGFQTHPTRSALLAELRAKNLISDLPSHLRDIYALVEESGDPLTMVDRASPLLAKLREETDEPNEVEDEEKKDADGDGNVTATGDAAVGVGVPGSGGASAVFASTPNLGRYVRPLTNVLLLKLLVNLSSTYHTVSLDHLRKLTDGLGMSFEEVEKGIVTATRRGIVPCKIDHQARCLRFGDADLEGESLRGHLRTLAIKLSAVVRVDMKQSVGGVGSPPVIGAGILGRRDRQAVFASVRDSLSEEHKSILNRKIEIEKRKEEVERIAQERMKREMQEKAEEEARRRAEDARRLQREAKIREKEKMLKIQQDMERMAKLKYLDSTKVEQMDQEEIDAIDVAKLAKEHAEKATKKKEEAERKLRESARRLDYIVRAIRLEELPIVKQQFEERNRSDRERYERETVEKAKKAKMKWEESTKLKSLLDEHKIFQFTSDFEDLVMADRSAAHESACAEADRVAEIEARKRKKERARARRAEEERRKAEEEERRRAEEEARRKEEERLRKEEALRKKRAEEEERRRAEDARMQEEQMRRVRGEREANKSAPPPGGPGLPSTAREFGGPPGGVARAGGGAPAAAASSSSGGLGGAASTGGKYIPPSRRGLGADRGGGGDSRGGGNFDRRGGGFDDRRGGGYGGGRYDRGAGGFGGGRYDRERGGGYDRDRGGYDRDRGGGGGGYDRDRGGGGGYDRDRGGGGYDRDRGGGGGYDRDRGGGGGYDRDRGGGGYDRDRGGGGYERDRGGGGYDRDRGGGGGYDRDRGAGGGGGFGGGGRYSDRDRDDDRGGGGYGRPGDRYGDRDRRGGGGGGDRYEPARGGGGSSRWG